MEEGQIGWIDLTVPNAGVIRYFYQHVTGWVPSPVAMGGYEDYCMTPPSGVQPVAGICHARGPGRYSIIEDPAGAVTGLFEPSGQ